MENFRKKEWRISKPSNFKRVVLLRNGFQTDTLMPSAEGFQEVF
jgi:hypothetical protein